MICAGCRQDDRNGEEYMQCMNEACAKYYHLGCAGTLSGVQRATWVCPECCIAARKVGRNCSVPVGTPTTLRNITMRRRNPPGPARAIDSSISYSSIMDATVQTVDASVLGDSVPGEVQLLREQMTYLTEQLADALTAIERYHSALTICTAKVEVVSQKLMKLENSLESKSLSADTAMPLASENDTLPPIESAKAWGPKGGRVKPKGQGNASVAVARPTGRTLSLDETRNEDQQHGMEFNCQNNNQTGIAPSDGHDDVSGGDWVEAQTRKKRRQTSIRCTAGPSITTLKAVEYRKYIHLWNMFSGAEDVREYLQSLCPDGSCTVEELKSKGDYRSYKLGVPVAFFDKCMSADVWPENARVKMWFFRKPSNKPQ